LRALLDVNVLIALLDAAHVHHRLASDWLAREIGQGWASCPITQNGCIRIMSQPAYPGTRPAAEVAARLAAAAGTTHHAFWPDDVDLLAPKGFDWRRILGPRHVTDACLLALAVRHRGRFVSFDRRIPLEAVVGARPNHLVVLG
jgi:toxin-antitoxin system PIN domain toxin